MNRQTIRAAKRTLSATLAALLVLYSLPPAVEHPLGYKVAAHPPQDDGMLLRHAAERLNLGAAFGEVNHQLWHLQSAVQDSLNTLVQACLSVPLAEAFFQYDHKVPHFNADGSEDFYHYTKIGNDTKFFSPSGTPMNTDGSYEYKIAGLFGQETAKAFWPDQNSPETQTLPRLDLKNENPEVVEYYNSVFSENPEATGYRLFAAHHVEDSAVNYPRALLQGDGASETLEYQLNFVDFGFPKYVWRDWRTHVYSQGDVDLERTWRQGSSKPIDFAIKSNPYTGAGYEAKWEAIRQQSPWARHTKQKSLYYWETDPTLVGYLNATIADTIKKEDGKGPARYASLGEVQGFWVEVQPFKPGVFAGEGREDWRNSPDFPISDAQFEIGVPFPYRGLKNTPKYGRLVFYRAYTTASGTPTGFLKEVDATRTKGQHGTLADYVCVGAFSAYPSQDEVIRNAMYQDYLLRKPAPGPSGNPSPTPTPPGGGGEPDPREEVLKQLSPADRARVEESIATGGAERDYAEQFLADAIAMGVPAALQKHSFFNTTDPSKLEGEPNHTFQQPIFFAQNQTGDPVDVSDGSQYYDFYDLQVPGRGMRTDFLRTYVSNYEYDFSSRDFKPLGHGWTHTYSQFLHQFPDGAIAFYDEHAKSTVFMPEGGGYRGPNGNPWTLSKRGDGSYQLKNVDGTILHFSGGLKRIATEQKVFYRDGIEKFGTKQPVDAGRLLDMADRNGNRFTLAYSGGRLTTVTDPGGRQLRFGYEGDRLTQMTDMAGRVFRYRYEGDNLVEVTHPGGRRQSYTYSGHLMTSHSDLDASQAWQFTYAGNKVSSVVDPQGNRTDYAYQGNKVTETVHEVDGRTFKTEFVLSNHNIVKKTDPQGTVYTYEYANHYRTKESFNRGDREIVTRYTYDSQGKLTRVVDPSGQATDIDYGPNAQPSEVKTPAGTTVIRLNERGNMVGATDPAGRSIGFTVDDQGQVQAVTDPGQHRTGLEHNAHGQLVHVDNPLGGWTTYTYNALGQVTSAADPNGTRRYEYDNKNHLHAYTDQLGRRTVLDTDANGNVTHVTDPGGRVTQLSYNKKNQLVLVRDNAGGETRYVYTSLGRLWKVTDPNGRTTTLERDGLGRVTRIVYPNQTAKTFKYDASGNVTEAANELAEATRYAYDALNRAVAVTDPAGQATSMDYNWLGAVTRVTNPLSQTTRFNINSVGQLTDIIPPAPQGPTHYRYNPDGTLAGVDRPKGQTTSYTYNAANQVLTTTDPRKTVRYEYDPMGRLLGVTAPRGRTVAMRRDALGRLTSVTDALGNPTEYEYWPSGELKAVRKVNGAVTTYEYDGVGHMSRVNAPEGRVSQFRYDKAGNLIEQTSPTGAVTDYAYDALNRLTALTDLAKGAKTSYTYDPAGRTTAVTDPNGQSTSIQYDRLGRATQVNAPLNARTAYEYDALGNVLKQLDANGHGTQYAYNANNRLVRMTDALNHQTTYDYDPLGNLTTIRRLADGATTTIAYNDLNLPEDVTDALSRHTRMQYDEFGNRTAIIDAKSRTTRMEYDALNRLSATFESLGRTTRYAYDRVGNMETVTNALGASTRMVYDQADRLRFLYEPLGRTTEYRYNTLDQVTMVRDANGNQNTVAYDRTGRPVREMDGLGAATDYFYDRLDRLTRKTDALGRSTQFQYDELSRLTGVTDAIGHQTRYRYDPVGNMTGLIDARGRQWGFNHDALDRVVLERDPLGRSTQLFYDPVGTLDQKRDGNGRVTRYGYDRLDRLTSVQTPEDLAAFTYDEVGNMTAYQNRSNRTVNRYDDLDQLVEESNMSWGKSTRYGYDVIGRLTQLTSPMGRSVRYGYDELDQLRTLTDPEGNRTAYQYDRAGRLTRTDYGNGNRTLTSYDQADRTRGILHQGRSGQMLQGYAYEYDRVGNRTQIREAEGHSTRYSYDALNRLQEVAYPIAAILAERKGFLPATASQPSGSGVQQASTGTTSSSQGSSGLPQLSSSTSGLGTTTRRVLSVQSQDGNASGNGNQGGADPGANGQGNGQGQTGDPEKDKNPDANGNGNAYGQDKDKENNGNNGNNGNGQGNGNGQAGDPDKDKNPDANGNGNAYGHKKKKRRKSTPAPSVPTGPIVTTPGSTPAPVEPEEQPVVTPAPQPTSTTSIAAPTAPQGNGNGPIKDSLPPGKQGNWGAHNQPYWDEPVATVRYSYDEVGNRTSEVSERGTTQYAYDEANQLKRKVFYGNRPTPAVGNTSHPHHADETIYQYDQNGNRVAETANKAGESKQLVTTRYEYDTLNRLVGIQHPENRKARYAYDPLGRLIESARPHLPGERPVQADVSRFSYAGQSVIGEWDGAGSSMAEFYHGNGQVVSKRLFGRNQDFNQYGVIRPSETHLYFQHDALGSVTGLSDSTGSAVMRYRQDAFGNPLAGILEPHNTQLLTEKRFDTQAGLYYFGSRWYDPGSGRFMNQDSYRGSAAEPMSQHRYAYVHNNPINMVDEWGYAAQFMPQPRQKSFTEWLDSHLAGPGEFIDSYLRRIEQPLNDVLERVGITNITATASKGLGSGSNVAGMDIAVGNGTIMVGGGLEANSHGITPTGSYTQDGTRTSFPLARQPVPGLGEAEEHAALSNYNPNGQVQVSTNIVDVQRPQADHDDIDIIGFNGGGAGRNKQEAFNGPEGVSGGGFGGSAGSYSGGNGVGNFGGRAPGGNLGTVRASNGGPKPSKDKSGNQQNGTSPSAKEYKFNNGKFENAPYHGKNDNPVKSKAPRDGQEALDNSTSLGPNTDRRLGTSKGEIVVLDKTGSGVYHGHVRTWDKLNPAQQSAMRKAGLVDKKGRVIERD